jgi:hypothetical protein
VCKKDDVSSSAPSWSFDLSDCTELKLPGKELGATGARVLADVLVANDDVSLVNLDGYDLDLRALRGAGAVDELDLSFKSLGPASAIVIAKMLEINTVLVILKCAIYTTAFHVLTSANLLCLSCAQLIWQRARRRGCSCDR